MKALLLVLLLPLSGCAVWESMQNADKSFGRMLDRMDERTTESGPMAGRG